MNNEVIPEQTKLRMPQIFIGKNYNKLTKNKFSFSGFFFGGIYFLYRKMYLYGIILYTLTYLLTTFLPKLTDNIILLCFIYLFESVIVGFITNPLYIKHVKGKLNKIRNKTNTYEASAKMCKKQGGTNLLLAIIIVIVISISFTKILNQFNLEEENTNNQENGMDINGASNVDYETLLSYVGTYVNETNTNTITIYILDKESIGVNISSLPRMLYYPDITEDGTLKIEESSFGEEVSWKIVQTKNGISLVYETNDESVDASAISGNYSKVKFFEKGWTGIYTKNDISFAITELHDELEIYITENTSDSISVSTFTVNEYNMNEMTRSGESFGETFEIKGIKDNNSITITASSTDSENFFNRISGTYTKE